MRKSFEEWGCLQLRTLYLNLEFLCGFYSREAFPIEEQSLIPALYISAFQKFPNTAEIIYPFGLLKGLKGQAGPILIATLRVRICT